IRPAFTPRNTTCASARSATSVLPPPASPSASLTRSPSWRSRASASAAIVRALSVPGCCRLALGWCLLPALLDRQQWFRRIGDLFADDLNLDAEWRVTGRDRQFLG